MAEPLYRPIYGALAPDDNEEEAYAEMEPGVAGADDSACFRFTRCLIPSNCCW